MRYPPANDTPLCAFCIWTPVRAVYDGYVSEFLSVLEEYRDDPMTGYDLLDRCEAAAKAIRTLDVWADGEYCLLPDAFANAHGLVW